MLPAAAGVVASATGVAVNMATDAAGDPWAWAAVVLLTLLGVALTVRMQRPAEPQPAPRPSPPGPSVHNSVTGTVHGGVVQAGNVGSVTIDSSTAVTQHAVARDGGTVYQAGRDVNPNR
ncbi:hypothetical protein CKY47_20705 [Saccharothrix yanglingensis]|uniref:Uncharacterized protein n=1 Tax=Saccharothrix yanglingensis TaxID=659496 RepID=A0ABU0X445_9PSEU|nr:hypothetical protein [Saccharothrix yanglingensis]